MQARFGGFFLASCYKSGHSDPQGGDDEFSAPVWGALRERTYGGQASD